MAEQDKAQPTREQQGHGLEGLPDVELLALYRLTRRNWRENELRAEILRRLKARHAEAGASQTEDEVLGELWCLLNNESKAVLNTENAAWGSGLQRAVTLIEQLRHKPLKVETGAQGDGWIKCSERLPERDPIYPDTTGCRESAVYEFFVPSNEGRHRFHRGRFHLDARTWQDDCYGGWEYELKDVSHYRELPAPPAGAE